jgi:diaminohydroxyphosphoribosylaminopyrimidine deaminase/5-amino-6-(5-phosphoribosylamino)uracil reductase
MRASAPGLTAPGPSIILEASEDGLGAVPEGVSGMATAVVETGWDSLLRVREAVDLREEPVGQCYFRLGPEDGGRPVSLGRPFRTSSLSGPVVAVLLDPALPVPPASRADAVFSIEDLIRVRTVRAGGLPQPVLQLFKTYLPYAFSSMHARRLGRAFAVSHFAQSLDGRIATLAGDSKRIGSPSNLVHAHRMRALSDGVIIGSRTLRRDRPRLTVRYVDGAQPARIVVASSTEGLDALTGVEGGDVYLVGGNGNAAPPGVKTVSLHGAKGTIPTADILRELLKRGIRSVYIEGGALTTSRFLGEGNVDVLQVHISPLILGSGLSSFRLPPVPDVASSLRLAYHAFMPVDDGMMIVGTFARRADQAGAL